MNANEKDETILDWDEWDAEQEEERVNFLKENFSFSDFWDYMPTQKILKNEFLQKYSETAGKEITEFYNKEHNYSNSKDASLFALDPHNTKDGFLEGIIFNHIKKDYDIEIFLENTDWTDSFVQYQLNSKTKKKVQPKIISKKSLREFNWTLKTYKKG